MKKLTVFAFLSVVTFSLASCGIGDSEDPNEIVKLKIKGDIAQKHYGLDDDWDFSGLSVYTVTRGGSETKLKSSEYNMTFNIESPKDFVDKVMLTFRYKKNNKIFASYSPTGISVDAPTYDEESEKSNYYTDLIIGSKTGETLRAELQRHSFEKHTTFVTYGNINKYKIRHFEKTIGDYIESVDLIPNESKNEAFYTGYKCSYSYGTREHVWACADSNGLWEHNGYGSGNVDNTNYIGGGSDLYHIRPVNTTVNTARGDAPFVDFDDSEYSSKKKSTKSVGDSGPYNLKCYKPNSSSSTPEFSQYVEVDDNMKGDLARIIAYVYMHYGKVSGFTPSTSEKSAMVGYLDLRSAIEYSESKTKQKLIEWNNLDPVSEVEKYRNHTVMQIQGNRNPFVDYPDLMEKVFG